MNPNPMTINSLVRAALRDAYDAAVFLGGRTGLQIFEDRNMGGGLAWSCRRTRSDGKALPMR